MPKSRWKNNGNFARMTASAERRQGAPRSRRLAGISCGAMLIAGFPQLSMAQSVSAPAAPTPETTVEDIVVIANRRAERAQDVPIAINSVSGAALAQRGVADTSELQMIAPSLTFNNPVNVGSPYVRGIGSDQTDPSSESPVAVYVDDVYMGTPISTMFKLTGVQQIDVLAGPQGTLFGRNTTGGVIQVRTLDPSHDLTLNASLTYGNYDTIAVPIYASIGLSDTIATDLSFLYENQGKGMGRNLFLGTDTYRQTDNNFSVRNKWLIELAPATKVRLAFDYTSAASNLDYQKVQGTFFPPANAPSAGLGYPGEHNSQSDYPVTNRLKAGGASMTVDQDVGGLQVTSVTAYRKTHTFYTLDLDASPVPLAPYSFNNHFRSFSQELRLRNVDPAARLKWVAGIFYYNAKGDISPAALAGVPLIYNAQKTMSLAVFGQGTFAITPTLNLTGGVRYTYERQQNPSEFFGVPAYGRQSVSKPTFRVSIDNHFTPNVMGYLSFNRGFKSGGYNLLTPDNAFQPERLDAYEAGLKTEFFDRRLRLNLAGFYYNYSNQQVVISGNGTTITQNAASSRIYGLEGNLEARPFVGLTLASGISVMHGRYRNFPDADDKDANGNQLGPTDVTGNHTINTPNLVISSSINYGFDTSLGKIAADVAVIYNDGFYWAPNNRLKQPSYTLVNAGLSLSPNAGPVTFRIWAKNLTDAQYYLTRTTVAPLVGDAQVQAAPRTYGLTVSYKY